MHLSVRRNRRRISSLVLVLTSGVLFQLGGCLTGSITTTTTISGRDFVLNALRGFIIAPLDAALVQIVDNVLDEEKD